MTLDWTPEPGRKSDDADIRNGPMRLGEAAASAAPAHAYPDGDFFEDLVVGMRVELGSHTFTRDEIVEFACLFDPQPFHIDEVAAARSQLGGIAASGWHTAAMWMKLYVRHRSQVRDALLARGEVPAAPGVSPGFKAMKWRAPVHPGDTIAYASTLTSKRLLRREPWGLVFHHNTGVNQHGHTVIEFDGSVFWERRPA